MPTGSQGGSLNKNNQARHKMVTSDWHLTEHWGEEHGAV